MIRIQDYFEPVSIEKPDYEHMHAEDCFLSHLTVSTSSRPVKDPGQFSLALVGVPEDRNSPNIGSAEGPDQVRKQLYRLSRLNTGLPICDLGNLKRGTAFNDTYYGLRDVVFELLQNNVLPILIGGTNDLMTGVFRALTDARITFDYTSVDARLDLMPGREQWDGQSYLNSLLSEDLFSLGHFASIGHQTYLCSNRLTDRLEKDMHEFMRLGQIRENLKLAEPVFRDSHAIAFDMSVVKQSDAPGHFNPSPNGLYSEEICLLARYAGLSDLLKVFGLFETNPPADQREMSSRLSAQVLWFFIEGFTRRQKELPGEAEDQSGRFTRYLVHIRKANEEITFVKSTETNRWWMEIPLLGDREQKVYRSCTYDDYLQASRQEIPERWLRSYKRFNDLA